MCEELPYGYEFEELAVDTKPLPDYLPIERVINIFQSMTERYFVPKFKLSEQCDSAENDQCILIHSNKICLFALPPNHPIILENKTVAKVNYEVTIGYLSGKKKRGSPKLKVGAALCTIDCEDGAKYQVKSGIKGNLIEINEKLAENPQLIATKPWAEGYIAIALLPLYLKHSLSEEFGFISLEEYEEKRPFVDNTKGKI